MGIQFLAVRDNFGKSRLESNPVECKGQGCSGGEREGATHPAVNTSDGERRSTESQHRNV